MSHIAKETVFRNSDQHHCCRITITVLKICKHTVDKANTFTAYMGWNLQKKISLRDDNHLSQDSLAVFSISTVQSRIILICIILTVIDASIAMVSIKFHVIPKSIFEHLYLFFEVVVSK